MKRAALLGIALVAVGCAGGVSPDGGNEVLPTYAVSGTLKGPGMANATLTLQGAGAPRTTTSDTSGGYQFLKVPTGNYTLTATQTGYSYAPLSLEVQVASPDVKVAQITSASQTTYAVSGKVSGESIVGVQLALKGNETIAGSATTLEGGEFRIEGVRDGTYTLTANIAGYTFIPASRTVTVAGTHVAGQDFGSLTPGWAMRQGRGNWTSAAMSDDGKYITIASKDNTLLTSTNYGVSWQDKSSSVRVIGETFAMSNDGKYLATASYAGSVYISDDYGDTWKDKSTGVIGSKMNWISITMSSDGKYLAAVVNGGHVYTSGYHGEIWQDRSTGIIDSNLNWKSIAMSNDGRHLAAVVSGGHVYTSSDYGETWEDRSTGVISSNLNWSSIAMSGDGQYLGAAVGGGNVYTSRNFGETWEVKNSGIVSGNLGWTSIVISDDGKFLAGLVSEGHVYSSIDHGSTWQKRSSGVAVGGLPWSCLGMSKDGRYLLAGVFGGNVYSYASP